MSRLDVIVAIQGAEVVPFTVSVGIVNCILDNAQCTHNSVCLEPFDKKPQLIINATYSYFFFYIVTVTYGVVSPYGGVVRLIIKLRIGLYGDWT